MLSRYRVFYFTLDGQRRISAIRIEPLTLPEMQAHLEGKFGKGRVTDLKPGA